MSRCPSGGNDAADIFAAKSRNYEQDVAMRHPDYPHSLFTVGSVGVLEPVGGPPEQQLPSKSRRRVLRFSAFLALSHS
jgi:hypothetical protein